MEPIRTLLDRAMSPGEPILPSELHRYYDGDLRFSAALEDRPYVIGNFVSTLDGVVSYEIPGHAGGGEISGHNEADRFIMGLLRASADAIMVGSGTLHATAPGHRWIPEEFMYSQAAEFYRIYRQTVLGKPDYPSTVIVSASGVVDLERAVFRTPGIVVQIVTTLKGRERLIAAGVDRLGTTEVEVSIRKFKSTTRSIFPVRVGSRQTTSSTDKNSSCPPASRTCLQVVLGQLGASPPGIRDSPFPDAACLPESGRSNGRCADRRSAPSAPAARASIRGAPDDFWDDAQQS